MSPKLRNFMILTPLSLISGIAMGQDKGGPPAPDLTIDPPVGDVLPLDDNLIYLLLLGVVLGIYFYRKNLVKSRA